MSFKAEMNIDGIDKTYRILSCSYNLNRPTGPSGKPQTLIHGGIVHVSVETSGDTILSDWMFSPKNNTNGTIKFYKETEDGVAKTMELTNVILVDYSESFSSEGSMPMMASLSLTAEKIKIGQGEHENEW